MYRLVCYFTLPLGSFQVFLFILFSSFLLKYYIYSQDFSNMCFVPFNYIAGLLEGRGPEKVLVWHFVFSPCV